MANDLIQSGGGFASGFARDLGRLEGRLTALEPVVHETAMDVKSIKSVIDQAKGGWKAVIAIGSSSGVFSALGVEYLLKIFPHISH